MIVSPSSVRHAISPKEDSVGIPKKIRVRMLKDKKASLDGMTETLLRKGKYYELCPDSAKQLIDREYCREDKALDVPKETKAGRKKRRKK